MSDKKAILRRSPSNMVFDEVQVLDDLTRKEQNEIKKEKLTQIEREREVGGNTERDGKKMRRTFKSVLMS